MKYIKKHYTYNPFTDEVLYIARGDSKRTIVTYSLGGTVSKYNSSIDVMCCSPYDIEISKYKYYKLKKQIENERK